jgi:hypothetical protein
MKSRGINRLMALLAVLSTIALPAMAQPTVTITSSSPTLQLPGTLTLTATVVPPALSGGVPTGTVQLFADGSTNLGTANLTILPATEGFTDPVITGASVFGPSYVFPLSVPSLNRSVLGALSTNGNLFPQLTIYSGTGNSLLQTSQTYGFNSTGCACPSPGGSVDGFSVGDFNADGIPDLLMHATFRNFPTSSSEYYVVLGKGDGTFDLAGTNVSSDDTGYSPFSTNPTIAIAADDFNGDGFADIAFAENQGIVGIAVNPGGSSAGLFSTYTSISLPPAILNNPSAIATGHLTSSGHADLIVGDESGAVVVLLGKGDGTFATPVSTPVHAYPSVIATADLRKSGITDVVISNLQAADIQVLFNDGTGKLSVSSTLKPSIAPSSLQLSDVNGDGYPDIVATGFDGTVFIYLNDGSGGFSAATAPSIGTPQEITQVAVADFNGDGLPDIVVLDENNPESNDLFEFLNSASSQITLPTPPKSLAAGTRLLTAVYAGDTNFAKATSTALSVSVTQSATTITWPAAAALEYGVPLSATQLDATASQPGSISYAPPAGTVLLPGQTNVTATFAPTDSFDYMPATAAQAITVRSPSLTGISPSSANLGASNAAITVNGQGFINGAVVSWNATPLSTSWVSLNQLTAVVPASLLSNSGTATITVADPNNVQVSGSATFSVAASQAVAQANVPATVEAGQNSSISLTLNSYPADVTATLTLSFAPAPPNTLNDPTVLFSNNSTTDSVTIPANSTGPIPAIDFSSGSTAGTITLRIQLTVDGVDITPAGLGPYTIAVPAGPPGITSAVLTRNGTLMTVAISGFSPTRDMTQAKFHFTPASGKSLKTTDLTVSLSPVFVQYYQTEQSDAAGTAYLYTQPFTLSSDADSVGTVTVTLSNSAGDSKPATAQ